MNLLGTVLFIIFLLVIIFGAYALGWRDAKEDDQYEKDLDKLVNLAKKVGR